MVIETARRRWVDEPDRSNAARVSFIWRDGSKWVRVPIARSLVDEPKFDLPTFLDDQADKALAARAGE